MHRAKKTRILGAMKRAGVVCIMILAFCGLSDSAYIAQHETQNASSLICDVKNFSGCNIVATSSYSHFFGIPIADYGIAFYSVIFILAALELVFFSMLLRRLLQGISLIGVVASLYFSYLEFFVIREICIFCIASAAIALVTLIVASFIEPFRIRQRL